MAGGMQLDANTLVLLKLADPQPEPGTNIYDYSGYGVKDLAGTYHVGPRASDVNENRPTLTWGLKGPSVRNKFSWWFPKRGSYGRLQSAVIDSAFIAAQRAAHTWEILVKTGNLGGYAYEGVMAVSGETGPGVSEDWLVQLGIHNDGRVSCFWENNDIDQRTTSPAGVYPVDNDWHVVTIRRKPYPLDTTKYICRLYVDGVLVVHQDPSTGFTEGTGLIPQVTSCSAGTINIGHDGQTGAAQQALHGWICNMRCIKRELTDEEIYANAADLLDDGEIEYDPVDTLCHWDFNDPPPFIDETDLGFHSTGFSAPSHFYPGEEGRKKWDLYRLNSRTRMGDNDSIRIFQYANPHQFLATHGRQFYKFFNTDLGMPEWTVEAYVLFPPQWIPGNQFVINYWGTTGEVEADNYLAQAYISTDALVHLYHERGAGTDVAAVSSGTLMNTAIGEHRGISHVALRCRTAPSDPTKIIHEWFWNGVLTQTVGPVLPPTGGSQSHLQLFMDWYGSVQEVKLSKGPVSDEQILANANAFGTFGPVIVNVTPAEGTALDPMTPVEFDVEDIVPGVEIVMIWIKYAGQQERWVVFDSDGFAAPFDELSTVDFTDPTSVHFRLLPSCGWEDEIEELRVRGIDDYGGIDEEDA